MSQPEYWLGRSYLSTARLNLQHYVWTRNLGYTLHPAIWPHLPESAAVAEAATGTGIWLLDLAASLAPTAQLHGFDVDLSQVCAAEWLPPNVSMHRWDLTQDPPAEHVGTYDVVHVRFIVAVVPQDPVPILQRLAALLKPGGWLQWTEQDPYTFVPSTAAAAGAAGPETDKLHRLMADKLLDLAGPSPGWVANLARSFAAQGLDQVDEDRRALSGWAASHFYDTVLMAVDEMAPHVPDVDVRARVRGAAQEMYAAGRGVAVHGESVTVVGRKPL